MTGGEHHALSSDEFSQAVGLSAREIITLAKNSFAASFLDDYEKQARIDAVDRYVEPFTRDAD